MAHEDKSEILTPEEDWLGYPKLWMNAFRSMQKMQNAPFMMYMKAFEVVITPEKIGKDFGGKETISEDNEDWSFTNAWQKSHKAAEGEFMQGMTEAWQRYWMKYATELFNQYAKMYRAFSLPWMNTKK